MDWIVEYIHAYMPPPTGEGAEMPKVVPMRVTCLGTGGERSTKGPSIERIDAQYMRLLVNEWFMEGIDPTEVVEALEAFRTHKPIRVAVANTGEVVGCDIIYEKDRWVWISTKFSVACANEWFN